MGNPNLQVEVSVESLAGDSQPADAEQNQSLGAIDGPISEATWQQWFKRWLETLHPDIPAAPAYELSLRLTGDADMQTLNAQYRQQNKPTDVLAFAALEADIPLPVGEIEEMPLYLGDIVISIETAQRQALERGHDLQTELAWLASHGLLHLLGWDHPDEETLTEMLNQQATLLKIIGLVTQDGLEVQS